MPKMDARKVPEIHKSNWKVSTKLALTGFKGYADSEDKQCNKSIKSGVGMNAAAFVLNFLHYARITGFSPFEIEEANGRYVIKRRRAYEIFALCISAMGVFQYFGAVRQSLLQLSKENPVTMLTVLRSFWSFIYKIVVVRKLWTGDKLFLKALEFMRTCPFLYKYELPRILSAKATIRYIMTIYTIVGICYGFLGSFNDTCFATILSKNMDFYSKRIFILLVRARYSVFLPFNCSTDTDINELSIMNYGLIIFGGISFSCRYVLGLYADLFLVVWVLTLIFQVRKFIEGLQVGEDSTIVMANKENSLNTEILEHYRSLMTLSSHINSVLGMTCFFYFIEMVFAYPINFYDFIWSKDIAERSLLFLFYSTLGIILICSAETCREIQKIRRWLHSTGKSMLTTNELVLFLDDLKQNSIGISASGIFTFNYSFLGTLSGILLTFFMIRLQFKDMPQETSVFAI